MMRRPLIVAFIAVTMGAGGVARGAPSDTANLSSQLNTTLEDFLASYGFPGVTAAIALPDGTVVTAVTGMDSSFEAGNWWAYSDTGYILLGMMIRDVAGEPWSKVVRVRFLDPLKAVSNLPLRSSRGAGVAIYAETPRGPVYSHGGWVPGYVSSLRYYADYGVTVALQINSDARFLDGSSELVPTLEAALADLALDAVR